MSIITQCPNWDAPYQDICVQQWNFIKNPIKIQIEDYKERQTYFGTMNLAKGEFILREYKSGNGENTMNFAIAASCGVSLRYASHTSWFGFTQQHPFGSCFYRSQQAAGYVSHRVKIKLERVKTRISG